MFQGTTVYEYDQRINDYNWYLYFFVVFIVYTTIHAVLRKVLTPPGDIREFEKKKKMHKYHAYYFQYTSIIHAVIGILTGKLLS